MSLMAVFTSSLDATWLTMVKYITARDGNAFGARRSWRFTAGKTELISYQ
jgi:hypothetical protein